MPDCLKKQVCLRFGKAIAVAVCFLFLTELNSANPGRIDLNFQNVLAPGANVAAIEIQPDGKILAAGKFTTRGATFRKDIVRLNSDGSIDPSFNAGNGAEGEILTMKLQPDGKILLGGWGIFNRSLARLNADGSLDAAFNITGINVTFVYDLDIQTNNKILISALNLIGSSFVTRLTADGSNEPGFGTPLFLGGGNTYRIAYVPASDKILIGGNFVYNVNAVQYRNLARINSDGTIDTTFTANVVNSSFDLLVKPKLLANGKILIFGKFDTVNQTIRRNVAILNSDGSLDASFNPATTGAETVLSADIQPDGKILIGGNNFSANVYVRGNVARLNPDGSADISFNQGRSANGAVRSVKIQNGKALLGGNFYRYHTFLRRGLARIRL